MLKEGNRLQECAEREMREARMMISRYERELDYIKMDLDYYKKKLDEQQIATQMEIADLENQLEVAKFKSESGFFEGNIMGVYVLLGFIFVRFFVLG